MHFSTAILSLAASAAVASAATVTFKTMDDKERTIYCTPNAGMGFKDIDPVTVNSSKDTTVTFPTVWIGNCYAVAKGGEQKPGMLAEFNFGGWGGLTYFDVSGIVSPHDTDNVHLMWPAKSKTPVSGCANIEDCPNAYWHPDDIQTKTTHETDIMCSLGSGASGLGLSDV